MMNRLAAALIIAAAFMTGCGGGGKTSDIAVIGTGPTVPVAPGGVAAFTMTVSNAGPDGASDILVQNVLDPRLTLVDITCVANGGAVCPASPSPGMTIPSLPSGSSVVFTVRATVPTGVAGLLQNQMSTRRIAEDPDLSNNSSTTGAIVGTAQIKVTYSAPTTEAAGKPVQFVAGITNIGPAATGGVQFSYTVPTGTTAGAVTCEAFDGAICPDLSQPVLVSTSMPVGSRLQLRIPFQTTSDQRGDIQSTFTALNPGDTSPDNNSATAVSTLVASAANLVVTHSVPAATAAGTNAIYTAQVVNRSSNTSFNVHMTQTLPSGLTAASVTCSPANGATCPATLGSVMDLASLPSSGVLVFKYTVPVPLALAGSEQTAVFAATGDADPATEDNTRSATTTVQAPNADLRATQVVAANTNAGASVQFTATVSNLGPDTARGVQLQYALSGGYSPDSITCDAAGGAVCPVVPASTMSVADMPAGGSLRFVFSVTAGAAGGSITGTFTAHASGDPQPANDTAAATTSIVTPPVNLSATASVATLTSVGTNAVFTARVTNGGPNAATNVGLVLGLTPAGFAVSDITCTASTGTTCPGSLSTDLKLPSLAAGAWLQLRYSVPVASSSQPGTVLAAEFRASADGDPAVDNNVATASTTIAAATADLSVSHSVPATVPKGQVAAFVALVSNQGPNDALNVTLTDTLAPTQTGVTVSCTALNGATCPSLANWPALTVPVLPNGAGLRFTVSVPTASLAVDATVSGSFSASYGGDPNLGDNAQTVSFRVAPAADSRNGSYSVYASDARVYTLTLDFDQRSYTLAGNGLNVAGSFTGPDGQGNYATTGNAKFRTGTDLVVGSFDFGAGVLPFVAGRSFATAVADLSGGSGDLILLSRVFGASGVASRTNAASWSGGVLRLCSSDTFYSVAFCPTASLVTYALSVSDGRFTGVAQDGSGQVINFRVARSGSELIFLRSSISPTDPNQRQFQIGLPDSSGPTGGNFYGATTAGLWGHTAITLAPDRYAFDVAGTVVDSANLDTAFPSGPTGVRGGARSSDGAPIVLMQVGHLYVLIGARNASSSGYMEIGLAP